MRTEIGGTTIEEAIRVCLAERTPEHLQELSELVLEQEQLLESKFFLYKMIIKHLIMSDPANSLRA